MNDGLSVSSPQIRDHYEKDVCRLHHFFDGCLFELENHKANAEFVAHAREDVPALLAEVERLREAHRKMHRRAQVAESQINQLYRWVAAFGDRNLVGLVFPRVRVELLKREIAELHDKIKRMSRPKHKDPRYAQCQAMMIGHAKKTIERREARLAELAQAKGEA